MVLSNSPFRSNYKSKSSVGGALTRNGILDIAGTTAIVYCEDTGKDGGMLKVLPCETPRDFDSDLRDF